MIKTDLCSHAFQSTDRINFRGGRNNEVKIASGEVCALIAFLKYAKVKTKKTFIPAEDALNIARRQIWINDVEIEIDQVSNKVATTKEYIANVGHINRMIKIGLNPERFNEIEIAALEYFSEERYATLQKTVKTLLFVWRVF